MKKLGKALDTAVFPVFTMKDREDDIGLYDPAARKRHKAASAKNRCKLRSTVRIDFAANPIDEPPFALPVNISKQDIVFCVIHRGVDVTH